VSTQTPEALLREYALYCNFTPADVEHLLSLFGQARRASALAMRDRAAQTLEGMLPGSGQVFRPDRAWGEKAVAAVRSLEV
jgi:hypothetical protein